MVKNKRKYRPEFYITNKKCPKLFIKTLEQTKIFKIKILPILWNSWESYATGLAQVVIRSSAVIGLPA